MEEVGYIPRHERTTGFQCAICGAYSASNQGNFCGRCLTAGCVLPVTYRPADSLHTQVQRVTAFDLARSDQSVFQVPAYPSIKVGPNSFVVGIGGPGAGKSTMGLRWAASVTPAAFVSAEMGLGPALGDLLRRSEIRDRKLDLFNIRDASGLFAAVSEGSYNALVIDSLTCSTLVPEDCLALAAKGPVVIGLAQVNKSGQIAGLNSWLHTADVVIEVESLKWKLVKSRFQPIGAVGEVLQCG